MQLLDTPHSESGCATPLLPRNALLRSIQVLPIAIVRALGSRPKTRVQGDLLSARGGWSMYYNATFYQSRRRFRSSAIWCADRRRRLSFRVRHTARAEGLVYVRPGRSDARLELFVRPGA